MSDELRDAAKAFYNATVADPRVTIRCQSSEDRDRVFALGEKLAAALTPAATPGTSRESDHG